MRKGKRHRFVFPLAGAVFSVACAGLAGETQAAIVIDGSLDGAYGNALATQTINTGFGDSTIGDGTSAGGSELDALYAVASNGNLNIFVSGNLEQSGGSPNHLNLFIADGRAGQSTLSASGGPLNGANGLVFPTGFSATYAIDVNDFSNTAYYDTYDLIGNTSTFAGGIGLTGGVGNAALTGFTAGVNNTNAAGVNGSSGTAASASAADAVTTGFEFSIPLSELGNPTGSVKVIAAINGGGDSYYSNQFLGGLPNGYGNLGSPSGVNLNGESAGVVVPVPEPVSLFAISIGGLMFVSRRRSRTV